MVRMFLISCLAAALSGCFGSPPPQPPRPTTPATPLARLPGQQDRPAPRKLAKTDWFEDVAQTAGVSFSYRDGNQAGFYQLLESVGGGAALLDYDRDGDLDLFVCGGGKIEASQKPSQDSPDSDAPALTTSGRPGALFRNDGDWKFVDVTTELQLEQGDLFYSHGCTAGDFDRDGWVDLFIAGYHGVKLYRNQEGKQFVDVTSSSGLQGDRWCVTGAWADYDNDGWLDLYVVTYADWKPDAERKCLNDRGSRDVCGPTLFEGSGDYLWRNRGDGTFENVSDVVGLVADNRGLGVVAADVDENGYIDFYVVNDVQDNQLYLNGPEPKFNSAGVLAGVAFSATGEREGSMGVDVGDYNNDGLSDLWCTNYANQDNALMKKLQGPGFAHVSEITGVIGKSRMWVGFGTGFADFDRDGWQDLFIANGHVAYERLDGPYFQPPQLLRNEAGKRFAEVTPQGGPYFSVSQAGRGAAVGDLDNNGTPDLVIVHQNDPVAILKNRLPSKPWLRVRLKGRKSNLDAIGAKVRLIEEKRQQTRWVRGGGGYLSRFDPRALFALQQEGDAPLQVTVTWPLGDVEIFANLAPGQTHELVEGTGKPVQPGS